MSSLENEIQRQKVTALYIINFHENTKKKGQEKLSAEVLQRRLELLESYWNNFFNRQLTICAHKDYSASESSHMVSFEEVEEAYINAGAYLQKMLQQSAPSIPAQQSTGSPTTGRLPKINLPTFSGDHVQWESFKDLFTSLVHDAPGLSDVVRLQYLKSSLTGEAAKIISNIPVTDANYRGAWQTLVNRYDNKRLLLYRHFQNLMGLKPMTTESTAALRTLLDTTVETRRALENLGRPVNHWDDWFIYLTTQKLESSLKKDWENSLGDGTHIPNFDELTQFLTNRLATMEVVTPDVRSSRPKIRAHQTRTQTSSSAKTFDSTSRNCACCKKNHYLGNCPDFKQKSVSQRRDLIAQSRLCFNCLRDHPVSECQSAHRCNLCEAKHHTLLHTDNKAHSSPQSVSSSHARGISSTLLATAVVKVTGSNGKTSLARALLDQGSEVTFISEDLAQRLRLPRNRIHVPIIGMGATHCGTVKAQVRVQLSSVTGQASPVFVGAYVLPRLTKVFRPPQLDAKPWPHLLGLSLADDGTFSSSRVDLVIGADLYGTILLDGLVKRGSNSPVAQNTIFGWVLSGRLDKSHRSSTVGLNALHCAVDTLSDELRRFWEIEEEASTLPLTPEEELCENHFQTTHERAPDGRFIVRLPKRTNVQLGMSYSSALQILQRNEKRQRRDIVYANAYRTFMQEYVHLGHMEPAPASLDLSRDCYYLPHHAVWKSEGQSSKIRVVFNASFRTSTGSSLNDCLLPGPKLQRDIRQVLLSWRRHAIVFTADIVKMFRQIWVHPEDRHLQRILWRESPDLPIRTFQLKTVTYGTACAPYLAIRCLQQLAKENTEQFPEAANVILRQTYVDDILAGADTLAEAAKLKDDLKSLLMAGGFELAKWASNVSDLADTTGGAHILDDGSVKTLGLQWHPDQDTFGFRVTLEKIQRPTKRTILSCIARLFDPLGWLAPVLINAKLFLQDLWTIKSDWDANLPPNMETAWIKYYYSLIELQCIHIPRWIQLHSDSTWEIHGFCDASQRAYAAAVYIKVCSPEGTWKSTLLTAKTKVAPLKVVSLPRLELCGAVLLARLLVQVMEVFQEPPKLYAWTDSQVVLHWLRAHPSRWKCFVANRTSEIHQLIPRAIWNHVPSGDNAADIASRGIPAGRLKTEDLWWHGPSWLCQPSSNWPKSGPLQTPSDVLKEENTKPLQVFHTVCNPAWSLQDRYSSLSRLLRVTAWIRRFGQNSRTTSAARNLGPLTTMELTSAQKVWIRICQSEAYPSEIQALTRNSSTPKGSTLLPLRPFLDSEGLLRVGGRLEHGDLGYDEKHPYIIPAKCNFSRLLIIDAHHHVLHGGPQLTLSHLYRRFWIIKGRRLVRDVIHSCVRCARHDARIDIPLMGQLPSSRITPSRPFLHTGLDYAGPVQLRTTSGRGHKTYKGYIALFVCMATKAIHLEAVSNYTTSGFIAAFKRFCSRRGIPATIASDQATNFRGADADLRRLLQTASAENRQIAELLANDGTQWQFIPPHSPHFGGLWEAGVRSVKRHLRRIVGDRSLTFEELSTVLTEIEACLNSRPLTPLSSAPEDCTALTPGHFLIGSPLRSIPEPSSLEVAETRLSRWQLLRRLSEHFWHRWSREYLQQLQQRSKWRNITDNIKVNDLVLVAEDNLPPTKWCLGRITQVHPGPDGIVRVVTLRTATTELQRPVARLCRLPIEASP